MDAIIHSSIGWGAPLIDTSIVIPIYKESHYLAGLLENLARQSWSFRTEIILCEYKPTGASGKIIGAFKAVYPNQRVRLLEIHDKGIASARNVGIEASEGQIIVNLDADNVFADSLCLEKLTEPIVKGIAVLTHSRIKIDTSEARNAKELEIMKRLYVVDQFPFIVTGVCFLKSLWEEVGGFENKDPYEMGIFAFKAFWLYPNKLKRIDDALLLTSARRTLKEKELGPLEHTFKRTTAVRGDKIIWGDEDVYENL